MLKQVQGRNLMADSMNEVVENKTVAIDADSYVASTPVNVEVPKVNIKNEQAFKLWRSTNRCEAVAAVLSGN